jgi:hypothetical protein
MTKRQIVALSTALMLALSASGNLALAKGGAAAEPAGAPKHVGEVGAAPAPAPAPAPVPAAPHGKHTGVPGL